MQQNWPLFLRNLTRCARLVALLCLAALRVAADDTNSPPSASPARGFVLPDLDDLKVKGVRISSGVTSQSDVGGQDPVSLGAPGNNFSAGVPLPAGGAASSKGEFVAAVSGGMKMV